MTDAPIGDGADEDTRQGFERLSDLPEPQRTLELERLRRKAPDRAARIARWLAADARASTFLDRSPLHDALQPSDDGAPRPEVVGPYDLGRELGRGGMGVVREAVHRGSGRRVAVKLLHPGLAGELEMRRFLQEAEVLRRLDHPGVARFLDAGIASTARGSQPYLAMELVDGLPLDAHAKDLDRHARLLLVIEACEAIDHAHRRGIVHRDLKPANVLVDRDGRVKVLDFGIARVLAEAGERLSTLTEPGQVLGTLAYTSPEQLDPERGPVDARSDVWSLGVLTYELLAGARPFDLEGTSLAAAARIVAEREPVPLARRERSCAGPLATVVHTAIAREPSERYHSAIAFADDLRRFLDGLPVRARRATPFRQLATFARRNRAFTAVLAAAALATTGGFVSSLVSAASERTQRQLAEQRATALEFELYRNGIGEVRRAIGDGSLAHARSLLAALPTAPEAFEARHFAAVLATTDRPLPAAQGAIYRMDVDAAGSGLVAAAADGTLRVYDLASGAVRHELDADGQPRRAILSPDGRAVLCLAWNGHRRAMSASLFVDGLLVHRNQHQGTAMGWADAAFDRTGMRAYWGWSDGDLRIVDVPSGRLLARTSTHASDVRCVAVAPAGDWVLCSGHGTDTSLVQADADDGTVLHRLPRSSDPIAEILFLGDGPRFAVRTQGGALAIHAGPRDDSPRVLANGESVQCIAATRDGSALYAGTDGGRILGFDVATGALLRVQEAAASVSLLALCELDHALAAATRDGRVAVYDLESWRLRSVLAAPRSGAGSVTQLRAVPGRSELAAGYQGGALHLHPTDVRRHATLQRHARYAYDVAFTHGGRRILSSGWDARLYVHDAYARTAVTTLPLPGAALAMEPIDERSVLLAIKDGPLLAVDTESGRELWRAKVGGWPHAGAALAVSPDGASILAVDPVRGLLRRHDPTNGTTLVQIEVPATTAALVCSPDGTAVAHGGTRQLALRDAATLALRRELPLDGSALDLAFSPDGTVLAVATAEGRVEVFVLRETNRVVSLLANATPIRAIAFDPTGKRLATGADDGSVALWDTSSWVRVLDLDAHEPSPPEPAYHYVHDVAFAPDGTSLVSASGDHTVRIWTALAAPTRTVKSTR